MQIARVPSFGIRLHRADYYGWRWCLHIGPWLMFWGAARERGG